MATWWQILGYESADEADKELASGAISDAEFQRARDEAFQQSSETPNVTPTVDTEDIPIDPALQEFIDKNKQNFLDSLKKENGKEEPIEEGGDTLYIVVGGGPPNYVIVAVNPGDADYVSGMSQQAAQETADLLNAQPPPSQDDETVDDDSSESDPNFFDVDARYNAEYIAPELNYQSVFAEIAIRYPYFPDDVLDEYAKNWVESGDDAVALAKTEASSVFKAAFPGIRREDGTMRYTVGEYLGVKEDMRVQVAEYGLNPEIFETQFNQLIEGDVSPAELARRLQIVQSEIGSNIPAVQQAFAAQFGVPISAEAILAAVVSPEIEEGLLQGTITAAQVQGEAIAAGFMTTFARSRALARAGLTQQQAAQTYQFGRQAKELAARAGREFILADVEEAAVGDTMAARRIQNIISEVESQSSVRLGAARTQLGAVSGLTEA